jgi:nucleotide-binding universal stress UspA family protein
LRDDIQKKLDELSARVKKETGLNAGTNIRTGKIYNEIVEESEDINASMIIMGTTGASTLKKKFLGSNASRVIKEALCPVITIKGHEHRKGCKRIVLPLDLTKETRQKVDKTIELAKLFGSTIHIITILETTDEFLINKLTRQLAQVKEVIEEFNVPCTSELIDDKSVYDGIIKYAQKINADLIVIMTQNETQISDLFIASSAQDVINHSETPVLCIRPIIKNSLIEFVTS